MHRGRNQNLSTPYPGAVRTQQFNCIDGNFGAWEK